MASLRVLALALLMGAAVQAQSPTFGVGRTPTAEEIRAWDISIGPNGAELPPGRGTVKEGALLYRSKGCAACHGANGLEGKAPILKSKSGPEMGLWARGRILPLRAPHATTVWDYINRAPSALAELGGKPPHRFGELRGVIDDRTRECQPSSVGNRSPRSANH